MAYWLVKSEPDVYGWDKMLKDGETTWDGIRNYMARNNLQAMKVGDEGLFYHSNAGKETGIVGTVRVVKMAVVDKAFAKENPGEKNPWVSVQVATGRAFKRLVGLQELKEIKALEGMALFKYGRLSVQPVTAAEWKVIVGLGGL